MSKACIPITITEHGAIGLGEPLLNGYTSAQCDERVFKALKCFNSDNDEAVFTLTQARTTAGGRVDALKAKSFVGVIQTKCGTIVEILPKIYTEEPEDAAAIKKIFFRMLAHLRDIPFRDIDTANLDTEDHILDIFIRFFLKEVAKLVQKGVVSDYVNIEENRPFLKGKLLFGHNIRHNFLHKERFFISYDEFISNTAENRLIKSTLRHIARYAISSENQQRLREFQFTFEEVPPSDDIKKDFSKVRTDRRVKHYERVLKWCRIFLAMRGLTNFKGESVAMAILFPMERVFQDFVGAALKKEFPLLKISLQDSRHYLLEVYNTTKNQFSLKPDIVIEDGDKKIILDAKWKLINSEREQDQSRPDGVQQSDLYQMFAYGKKYNAIKLFLLYPSNENFSNNIEAKYDDDMALYLSPINLRCLSEPRSAEQLLSSRLVKMISGKDSI